jgi:hypothetical protein
MPAKPASSSYPKDIKKILETLKRIENKINECCPPSCIDFTKQKVGKLAFDLTEQKRVDNRPHEYKLTVGNYKLKLDYPVTDPPGLDVEPIPKSSNNENGIAIPQKLFVYIVPQCRKITVDIAKSTSGGTLMVQQQGQTLQELTLPAKETAHYVLNVDVGKKVDRLVFFTGHKEVYVKRICCYG